jgi:predicted secreted protein
MAFTTAESEESSVITDEGDALTGVAGLRTKVTCFNPERVEVSTEI